MATIAAKAARRANVNQRLSRLSEQIADQYGVEIPPVPRTTRDPDLDQIIELERIADVFEQLTSVGEDVVDLDITWANPGFVDMSREDMEKIAVDWYQLDPAEFPDDMALHQALIAAYEADTGGEDEDVDAPDEPQPELDFVLMKRAELDDAAPKFGIDPAAFSKVDDLRAALVAASNAAGEV